MSGPLLQRCQHYRTHGVLLVRVERQEKAPQVLTGSPAEDNVQRVLACATSGPDANVSTKVLPETELPCYPSHYH
jgi:hypothetical protein